MKPTSVAGAQRRPLAARNASRWPFRAPLPESTHVTEFGVGVPGRQEVEFKDSRRIWLSRVLRGGTPDLFMRTLGAPAEGVLIDLRQLITDVEHELPATSTRDVAGFVAISLRLKFATLDAFLEEVVKLGRPA